MECGKDRAHCIWFHASSVGEVQVARALVSELKAMLPDAAVVLSTMTEQGRKVAEKQLGGEVQCINAPLDLAGIVDRSIKTLQPSVYVCLETELWPNILLSVKKYGTRIALLNGRMSEKSFRRYRLIRGFISTLLSQFSEISVIQEADANRYISLGAAPEKVRVLGNAKYDLAVNGSAEDTAEKYRQLLGIDESQPVLMAGSTHSGEEQILYDVYQDLKANKEPGLVFIVAPRHIERLPEIVALFAENGVVFDLLSDIRKVGRKTDVIIVDSMGELAKMYSVATYVFCGGSLVARGGHNVMEAAVHGKPVFYGPSMDDFADAAQMLESAGAGYPVASLQGLKEGIRNFISQPEEYEYAAKQARKTAMQQVGSAQKQAQLIVDMLAA